MCKMKYYVLKSGSSGNCCYIEEDGSAILIDCGMSFKSIKKSLLEVGEDTAKIKAILITHEHNDHISGLSGAIAETNARVYVHSEALSALSLCPNLEKSQAAFVGFSEGFEIEGFHVDFIPLSHDSAFCVGFRVTGRNGVFASLTDTGALPSDYEGFISNADTLLLESNYDDDMLIGGKYPWFLKKRISGVKGHLSNIQTVEALKRCPDLNVKRVILGHLSENNNTAELAFDSAQRAFRSSGITEGKDIRLEVIPHGKRSVLRDVEFK